ncbi:RnfABCDGE type electron transport complex subunit D [Actinomycetes bacterium NPDC127524]
MNNLKYTHMENRKENSFSRMAYRHPEYKKKKNKFQRFINTPKGYLIMILIVLFAAGIWGSSLRQGLMNTGSAIMVAVLTDLAFAKLKNRQKFKVDGGIISALILSMVLSTEVPWYQVIIITFISILSKHLIVLNKKPIFNPAAFGLFVSIILFSSGHSWWGGMSLLSPWLLLLVIIGGFAVTEKVNKFPQVLTFLGVYFLFFALINLFHLKMTGEVFRPPFINSTLFLAFFMITDPPTSPAKYKDQIIFGFMAAAVSIAAYLEIGGLTYLLDGLLLANIWKALAVPKRKKLHSVNK